MFIYAFEFPDSNSNKIIELLNSEKIEAVVSERVVKEKDLEQLAAVKEFGIKYLIALDRDFEKYEEYRTPKQFVELFCGKREESDF